jgi:hypothetical protein
MHGGQDTEDEDLALRYLEALHGELHALGMTSEVVTSGSEPRLRLGRPYTRWNADSCFEGHVLAARVSHAGWCYWWPWVQVIGTADDPAKAAQVIADEFGIVALRHPQDGHAE